ncbi:renalase isoform X2 [Folsomia candida]|uniref:renalase isoform X2 n=1 Tax=Folsomia candida TaxID=158441 RepID=UPI001604FC70|nr:renalase isoform X2 [Folsomia candida]
MSRKKLLLIGAGPTSSLIIHNLQSLPHLKNAFDIQVWEKDRRVGGRFLTFQSPTSSSYGDLDLLDNKLIRRLDTLNIPGFNHAHSVGKVNYVCTSGAASIVEHFFHQADNISLSFDKHVTGINTCNNGQVSVITKGGDQENYDIVITTIPVPQLLKLSGSVFEENSALQENLRKVQYTTRFALGLFYDSKEGPFANLQDSQPLNFIDDPIIRYWSVENRKRGTEDHEQCAIVAHTSVMFGAENMNKSPDSVKDLLLEKVYENLKPAISSTKLHHFVKCHKWKYSQVANPYLGTPGFVELTKSVIAAGDGFVRSGFEGCIESSQKTVEFLLKSLI